MTIHMGLEKAGAPDWEKQERRRIENTVGILNSVEDTLRSMRNELQRYDAGDKRKVKRYNDLKEILVEDTEVVVEAWKITNKK